MFAALRHGALRKLLALYSLEYVLEWFGSIALMVLVYDATSSALAATGMLLCKQLVPAAVLPVFTSRLDGCDTRIGLIGALAAGSLALVAAGLLGYGPWLFALAALAGSAGAAFRASLRAGVVRSVGTTQLRPANAALNTAAAIAATAGPALAAAAVTAFGVSAALIAGGLGLAGLAVLACSLPALMPSAAAPEEADEARPARRTPGPAVSLAWLLGGMAAVTVFASMDEPVLLPYAEHALGAGVAGYGAIYTLWGVGLALGSFAFTRLLDRSMVAVAAGSAALAGLAYAGLGVAPTLSVALAFALVGGIGNGICWLAAVTAVQESAAEGEELMVAGRLEAIATAAPGVGVLLGGVLADLTAPRLALLVPGLLILAVIALGAFATKLRDSRPALLLSPSTPGGSA